MVDKWLCLYIGVFWYKLTHYLASIIHIILFYRPFGVQKLVTELLVNCIILGAKRKTQYAADTESIYALLLPSFANYAGSLAGVISLFHSSFCISDRCRRGRGHCGALSRQALNWALLKARQTGSFAPPVRFFQPVFAHGGSS